MDAARWEHVQSIFSAVADLPSEEQSGVIHAMCEGDESLSQQVRELLDEDARRGSLLDSDLNQLAEAALNTDQVRSLVQRQIGPYRLLRVLGEGGMGVVYLAERTDIGGLVAIKLLRDAWLSPMRRERFVLEQQILVKLNHPAIARIYDASTMQDGTPWFVMEYADGQPFTTYLRNRAGTVRDDLLLFRHVCEAVQYAHSHAVIHRDLKPSNILVTAEGDVKLLDFGIAKQMDLEVGEREKTISGLRFMTPAYAAPEQRTGGNVGVFTDIYALGLLLYELLTGGLPEADAAAREKPIARPSSVACKTPGDAGRSQLGKRDWADLDVLCLTALEQEPDRRYRSVDAMLRDLDAYLEGRVLEARPKGFLYIAGKFARRNAATLASAAAGVLLLAATAIIFTVRLAHARDAALAEAARTARIQHFTEDLFTGGDASAGPAADLKVTALLDRGQTEAESLRSDPRMQADLYEVLGGVYQKLGRLDQAGMLLGKALEERHARLGKGDRQYAESLVAMGLLREDQRRMAEAEKLLRQGLAMEKETLQPNDPAIERALWALGSVEEVRGNYSEAKGLLRQAVAQNSGKETERPQLARDLTQLGDADFHTGSYEDSEHENKQALAINESLLGDRNPAVADNLNNLGHIALDMGQNDEAERYFSRAVAVTEAWYGADHPQVASNLRDLSEALHYQKKNDQAEALLERALTIQKRTYGPSHPSVALVLDSLGGLAYYRDRDDEAEKDYREALRIWSDAYGQNHPFVGTEHSNLGGIYLDRKDYPGAEAEYRKALQIFNANPTKQSVDPAIAHVKLGHTFLRAQQPHEAEPETLAGYRYLVVHVPATNGFLKAARKDLVAIETALGQTAEAARYQAELDAAKKAQP